MSELVQEVIVAAAVVGAMAFLLKRLRPSTKGVACAGCPYGGSCNAAKDCPAAKPKD